MVMYLKRSSGGSRIAIGSPSYSAERRISPITWARRSSASEWVDFMARVIEFDSSGRVPQKVKPLLIEQRGKLVAFPKEQVAVQSQTENTAQRGEVSSSTFFCFGCF